MKRFFYGFLVLSAVSAGAAEYFVAVDGNDAAAGAKDAPWATLQSAANRMQPGDICTIRGGMYFQPLEISGLKGTADKPVIFRAFEDEIVILDGTELLTPEWTTDEDGISSACIGRDIWQLFSGAQLLDLARWPNASVNDGSIWDLHTSMRSTDRNWDNKAGKSDSITQSGIIFDQNPEGAAPGNEQRLAETGIDFTGAIAVLNIGHWLTWARPVLAHEAGSNQFTYDPEDTRMLKFLEYYIFGRQALDAENEWWFDAQSKTLSVKFPSGNPHPVRGRVRDYNLIARNCEFVQFQGLDFFASTFLFDECENMVMAESELLYPSTHKFGLGELGWFSHKPPKPGANAMTMVYNSGDADYGNVVRDCTIAFPNSPSIGLFSKGAVLENCYIHDVEWDVNSSGGSGSLPGGDGVTVRDCTLHTTGASEGIRLGAESTIEGNHIYNTSLLQHDGSAVNIGTPSQPGTIARRNWIHDTNRQAIRFDSTTSAFGTDAAVVENVFFNVEGGTGGNKFKGDYQLFANNTAFDCFVAIPKGFGDTDIHNENSLVCNNLVDHLVEWNMKSRVEGIPARMENNVAGEGSVRKLLRDPDNLDFRPKPDAEELVDAGKTVFRSELPGKKIRLPEMQWSGKHPDIGAYDSASETYWIPGFTFKKAAVPVPPAGATQVKPDADLMWKSGQDALGHTVYFGSNADEVSSGDSAGERLGLHENIFNPGTLEAGETYFWRVDVKRADGSVQTGDVWSFTVDKPDTLADR